MAALKVATIVLAAGCPGMGKSALVQQLTRSDRRVLVFDPTNPPSHAGMEVRGGASGLLAAIRAAGAGRARLLYRPAYDLRAEFDSFCVAAMAWGNCSIIVEELANVTHAGKAPPAWGRVIRESRHFRLRVYATTQRPAESDKTIFGCASRVAVFHLPRREDRVSIARDAAIPPNLIEGLPPLHYIESDMRGRTKPGVLRF